MDVAGIKAKPNNYIWCPRNSAIPRIPAKWLLGSNDKGKTVDEIKRTIQINPNQDDYEGFFCDSWKTSFLSLVRHSKLREPAYDLTRTWEAISNARQLPWLMTKCLDINIAGKLNTFEIWDCKKIHILGDKLLGKLEEQGEPMRPMLNQKLRRAIKELDKEIDDMRLDTAEIIRQKYASWQILLEHISFRTSIWGLERLCYGGLYYGYEWYLTHCLRLKKGKPGFRWRDFKTFAADFQGTFGSVLKDACLDDMEIKIAYLTRNALAHNGGRITPQLKALPHTFLIEGDEIQINAYHTTSLFHKLKDRATDVTQSAIAMPEFKEENTD